MRKEASATATSTQSTTAATTALSLLARNRHLVPGLLATLGLAFLAHQLGSLAPLIGGPIFGIVLGMGTRALCGLDPALAPGVRYAAKKVLQASIVVLGGSMSLLQVWQTGRQSLGVMLLSLAAGLIIAFGVGRLMGVPWRLASLIGAGTSICGASAIAAVSPVVRAEEDETAYSISTVFLFNILAVLIFPVLGHLLDLTDQQFGLWTGTAINDTSSVVAVAFARSPQVGSYAAVVKLARSTMILPVALGFATLVGYRERNTARSTGPFPWQQVVPWFIFGFLGMALLNTAGLFGEGGSFFKSIATFGITMALVGVGLGSDFGRMRRTGLRPLILGMLTWLGVALVSIVLIL